MAKINKTNKANFIANMFTYSITLLISFLLTPYITTNLGTAAFGFISLSNTLVSYFAIITLALNSMANRFITIEFHKGNLQKANKYYTSVFFGNIIISLFIMVFLVFLVFYLDVLIDIPTSLVLDVKFLFSLSVISFLFGLNSSIFSISFFVKNKLYYQSIQSAISSILKGSVIFLAFSFLKPSIVIIGYSTLAVALFGVFYSYIFSKRIMPEMAIRNSHFDLNSIKEITFSGIWNSIVKLGNIFLEGVDLLIANIFIGPFMMGVLAISKTIPNIIITFIFSITNLYLPELMKAYANDDKVEISKIIFKSNKMLSIFTGIPLVILFVMGRDFYNLWLPEQDSYLLWSLTILAIINISINGNISIVYTAFSITNKLKQQAMYIFLSGISSTAIVLFCISFNSNMVYYIAGVSVVITLLRDLIIFLPKASKLLFQSSKKMYIVLFRNFIVVIAAAFIGILIKKLLYTESWLALVINTFIIVIPTFLIFIIYHFYSEIKTLIRKILKI